MRQCLQAVRITAQAAVLPYHRTARPIHRQHHLYRGSTDSSSDTSSETSETSSIDESKLTEEQIYDNMIERSLMDLGNLERMSKFIGKLENKQEVTIAFIGGSITEGLTAGPEKCWAKLTYDRLCEKKYPDTKINYVNAGLSGTPSVLGNIRLQRDVLDHKPDMVFVEFAVNDGNDQIYKDSYDAMVRKILSQENQPAVALYFTVIKSGHTCEEYMSQVGKAYGLPMVSLNNVLSHEFETGRMKWEDYSDDESHPNEWGHKMTADLIMNMFDKATEKIKTMGDVTLSPLPDTWVYSDRFADMTFIDRTHSSDKLKISSTGTFDTEKETLTSFPLTAGVIRASRQAVSLWNLNLRVRILCLSISAQTARSTVLLNSPLTARSIRL